MEMLTTIRNLVRDEEFELASDLLVHVAKEGKDIEEVNKYIKIIEENKETITKKLLLDFLEDYVEYMTDDCE